MNGMMLRFRSLILAAALPVVLGGCSGTAPTDPLRSSSHAVVNATVQYLGLEGGCWTLAVAPRSRYLPLNLPDQFRKDGFQVHAELVRRDDYASVCVVGPVVEIVSIQPR